MIGGGDRSSATDGCVLRPEGVYSGGFNSPGQIWFFFALLVILFLFHVIGEVLSSSPMKEVLMNNGKKKISEAAFSFGIAFLRSVVNTIWAIGTSLAAGALSA